MRIEQAKSIFKSYIESYKKCNKVEAERLAESIMNDAELAASDGKENYWYKPCSVNKNLLKMAIEIIKSEGYNVDYVCSARVISGWK